MLTTLSYTVSDLECVVEVDIVRTDTNLTCMSKNVGLSGPVDFFYYSNPEETLNNPDN